MTHSLQTPTLHWQTVSHPPAIRPGEIHLWRIFTHELGQDLDACHAALPDHPRTRAERIRKADQRERYLRAQAALHIILGRYLDCDPREIRFEHGPHGKPYLPAGQRPFAFNLTTTSNLALLGLCAHGQPNEEIGVDCERMRPLRDLDGIARRMFEPRVTKHLLAQPEYQRSQAFFAAWTALEADAKTDGRGLFRTRESGDKRPQIRHCIPIPGYIAAVSCRRLPPVAQWSTFAFDPT